MTKKRPKKGQTEVLEEKAIKEEETAADESFDEESIEEIQGEESVEEKSKEEFECPLCGAKFSSKIALNTHIGMVHHPSKKLSRLTKKIDREIEKIKESEERVKTIEEEIFDAMYTQLNEELKTLPGVNDAKRTYILTRFKNLPELREHPAFLYDLIARNTRASPQDIQLTVQSVFNIKAQYESRLKGTMPYFMYKSNVQQPNAPFPYFYPSYSQPSIQTNYPPQYLTMHSTIQNPFTPPMQMQLQPSYQESQKSYTEADIDRIAKLRAKKIAEEMLEKQKKEEEIMRLKENISQLAEMINQIREGAIQRKEESLTEKLLEYILKMNVSQNSKLSKEDLEKLIAENRKEIMNLLDKKEKEQTINLLAKQLKDLEDTLRTMPRHGVGDFASDDAKIISRGLSTVEMQLSNINKTIRTMIEQIPELLKPYPEREKVPFTQEELEKIEKSLERKEISEETKKEELGLLEKALEKEEITEG